jgi:uncharacterized protein (TIGR00661 family)
MKILYGIQGTGNGHITRARAMQNEFAKTHIEVDYLFSGRAKQDYFEMQCFESACYKKGLTFKIKNGKVKYFKTAIELDIKKFKKDVKQIDASNYDLIITDFEPITARLAKKNNVPIIGLGHQYVFEHCIPQQKGDFFAKKILKYFAPAKDNIALHWHHFGENILPPILVHDETRINRLIKNKVLVYLPFENQNLVYNCLAPLRDYEFIIYCPNPLPLNSNDVHIKFKNLSRQGFLDDLYNCDAIIANAGFELSSEALLLGKRLLVKPLSKQVEQQSNALALKKLLYGNVINNLNTFEIRKFLNLSFRVQINFPNTAKYVVDWIKNGCPDRDSNWYKQCWKEVKVNRDLEISETNYRNLPEQEAFF